MSIRLVIRAPNSLLVIAGAGAAHTPIPDGLSTVVASDDTIMVMTEYSDVGPTIVDVTVGPAAGWPSSGVFQTWHGTIRSPGGTVGLYAVDVSSYGEFDVGTESTAVRVAIDRDIEPRRIDLAFDPIVG